jgi:hypothetical protein
MTLMSRRLSR